MSFYRFALNPFNITLRKFSITSGNYLTLPVTKTTVLPNNITVSTEQRPGNAASLSVFLKSGSFHENKTTNGLSNFFSRLSVKANESEFENFGGSLHTTVERYFLELNCNVLPQNLGKSINLLGKTFTNGSFSEDLISKEKELLINEISNDNRCYEHQVYDHLHNVAYQDSTLGQTTRGPASTVKTFNRSSLDQFIQQQVGGDHLIVTASGNVNHDDIVSQVQESFKNVPKNASFDFTQIPHPEFIGSGVHVINDDLHDIHTAIAVETGFSTIQEFVTAVVIQNILGSWSKSDLTGNNATSRLGELVATENLANSFHTFIKGLPTNKLLFGYYAVTDSHHSQDFVCEIVSEWVRLANSASDSEVNWAKQKAMGSIVKLHSTNRWNAFTIGRQTLNVGRRIPLSELASFINSVDANAVRSYARQYLNNVSPAVVAIGNLEEYPDYELIRGWTY